MTSPPPGQLIDERHDNFNALRLISAFAILVSHFYPLRDGDNSHEPFQRFSGVCNIGKLVTYVCFVIGGMAVTRAYLRQPRFVAYLIHRLSRLLPGLIAAVFFCVVVGLALTNLAPRAFLTNPETIKFAANAAMYPNHYTLPGVFNSFAVDDNRHAVNGSLWVIAPLFLMYLLVPVLGALNLLRRPQAILFLAALFFGAWEAYAIHGIPAGSRLVKYAVWIEFIPHLGFFFLCGVAVAVAKKPVPANKWLCLVSLCVIAVTLRTRFAYTAITLGIPFITIFLSFAPWRWIAPLNAAGVIAYGVYLFGWPLQQLFIRVWTPNRGTFELILYPSLACVIVATLTWFVIERPALMLAARPERSAARRG